MNLAQAAEALGDACLLAAGLAMQIVDELTCEAEADRSKGLEAAQVWLAAGEQAQERAAGDMLAGGIR